MKVNSNEADSIEDKAEAQYSRCRGSQIPVNVHELVTGGTVNTSPELRFAPGLHSGVKLVQHLSVCNCWGPGEWGSIQVSQGKSPGRICAYRLQLVCAVFTPVREQGS